MVDHNGKRQLLKVGSALCLIDAGFKAGSTNDAASRNDEEQRKSLHALEAES